MRQKNVTYTKNNLKVFLKKLIKGKIFIISGLRSYKKSGANKILSPILKKKKFETYFKNSEIPVINELEKIIKKIKLFKPNVIIAIGGGAVMDYAKIANYLCNTQNLKKNIIQPQNFKNFKYCKLIAIPTTAGSGAEVTSNAVIYINKKKFSVENKLVKPDNFLLLPNLILKNKKNLKTSSGFDAIAQAVESLFSLKSNNKSIKYATESLKITLKNFIPHIKKPTLENSKKMLIGANLAGKAINISKTTAPHALSYPFTTNFNISHGHAVGITFNEFLKFNYKNLKNTVIKFDLKSRFNILFKLSNTKNIFELDDYFKTLKKEAGIKDSFLYFKINIKKNLKRITKDINFQRLSNNPVKIKLRDINKILLNKN